MSQQGGQERATRYAIRPTMLRYKAAMKCCNHLTGALHVSKFRVTMKLWRFQIFRKLLPIVYYILAVNATHLICSFCNFFSLRIGSRLGFVLASRVRSRASGASQERSGEEVER